ncbi:MAG: hypothetical protein HY740_09555 [Chloroflexi bacterium]|nr:hypothetical protein [Chloroflexota bacterium]
MTSSTPKPLQTLNIISILMFIISLGLVFFYAPREAVMGEAQRIFYYHVPSAWLSFDFDPHVHHLTWLGFFLCAA